MKIYTYSGDGGTTSLSGGRRVPKHHVRVEAYGTVDELIAWIGLLRDHKEIGERKELLLFIQDQLMRCAAVLATETAKASGFAPDPGCVEKLEKDIDLMQEELKPLKNFILPGGSLMISYCHVARCVCRRAERSVSRLIEEETTPPIIIKFLNRLSDFLFVLSRKIALDTDTEEIKWSI